MSRVSKAAKMLLKDLNHFSRLVIGLPLYPYQVQPMTAVLSSIVKEEGLEFLLIFPRQSGKNEAVAQLLVLLLNLFQRRGGNVVYGAIGDGLGRGIGRLEDRLANAWNDGQWKKKSKPLGRSLGRAAVTFLSSHPQAFARGETADLLLVIDELQDQDATHLEQVFEPMRAARNAAALYLGTVKTSHDALWLKKQELEALEKADGRQRVFVVQPDEVSRDNPAYGRFLDAKIARLGRKHPIVASEYFGEPLDGEGGLFDERRRALMRGTHRRQHQPENGRLYVATLDVGGQDEGATEAVARLKNPGRDYTIAHIFEVILPTHEAPGPTYRAIDVFTDHGSRHFEDIPGRPSLANKLLAWFQHWDIVHLVSDDSGVGEGLTSWLAAKLGQSRVTGYEFSGRGKAQLGSRFISTIETNRFKYFAQESEYDDAWWFFTQAEYCSYFLKPDGIFDRDLQWSVPDSARTATPQGKTKIHDDRLISAALVATYDELWRSGAIRLGHARSTIINPVDPLRNMEY